MTATRFTHSGNAVVDAIQSRYVENRGDIVWIDFGRAASNGCSGNAT